MNWWHWTSTLEGILLYRSLSSERRKSKRCKACGSYDKLTWQDRKKKIRKDSLEKAWTDSIVHAGGDPTGLCYSVSSVRSGIMALVFPFRVPRVVNPWAKAPLRWKRQRSSSICARSVQGRGDPAWKRSCHC